MLRFLVLLLLLANGTFYAWSHGLLRGYGFAPATQTEPQRVAQQILPDAIRLIRPEEARRAETAPQVAAKPVECLQAGVFNESQAVRLRSALEATFPTGTWLLDPAVEPARWIVYMGKYPNAEALAKKRAELASLNLRFEALTNPSLEIGLSLGGFETQAAANSALTALSQRGVRTARVVQERTEFRGVSLKIPAVDDSIRSSLVELKPALAGKPLRVCK